mgnify:CR=1 FL=1
MLEIFYEDKEIIVVKKPVGMESQASHFFAPDLVSEIRKHINRLSTGKGEPYVGVIHRLDKPVGGIMVYAKTKKAAGILSAQVQSREMQKMYMAVVCGKPVDNVDNFVDYLLKDCGGNMSRIVEKGINGGKRAELSYQAVETLEEEGMPLLTLVKIRLVTGRHHQIRVQFAGHGLPLWGDSRYNPEFACVNGLGLEDRTAKDHRPFGLSRPAIALSACELTLIHPSTKKQMHFQMEPEGEIFSRFKKFK